MEMNIYDYALKRKIGYFAVRYLKYLEENYPEALSRFLDRTDSREILRQIQDHCQLDMQNLMLMLDEGKGNLTRHRNCKAGSEDLAEILKKYIVKEAQNFVFDGCTELLQYAQWMNS